MNNLLKTKITESPNGAHERASHTTIETIYKGLMKKIGAGQVTIHYQSGGEGGAGISKDYSDKGVGHVKKKKSKLWAGVI